MSITLSSSLIILNLPALAVTNEEHRLAVINDVQPSATIWALFRSATILQCANSWNSSLATRHRESAVSVSSDSSTENSSLPDRLRLVGYNNICSTVNARSSRSLSPTLTLLQSRVYRLTQPSPVGISQRIGNNEWRNGANGSIHHFRHSLFPIRCDIPTLLPQKIAATALPGGAEGGLAPAATLRSLISGLSSTQGPGRIQSARVQSASRVQRHDGRRHTHNRKPKLTLRRQGRTCPGRRSARPTSEM